MKRTVFGIRPRRWAAAILILAINSFVFSGCAVSPSIGVKELPSPAKPLYNELADSKADEKIVDTEMEKNQALWQEKKITDYDIEAILYAGGVRGWAPVLMKVRGGRNVSIEYLKKEDVGVNIGNVYGEGYSNYDSVEKMFDTIRKNLEEEDTEVSVKYNKSLGYPEKIRISATPVSAIGIHYYTIDAWLAFEVTKFKIVN